MAALPPGSIIGILGGGQLGRMLSLAGAKLGLRSHVFAPEQDNPAFQVSAAYTVADYRDETALARFASQVQAVTYEFENVPVEAVTFLEQHVPVRPGSKALGVAQDRLQEKALARQLGARTAEYRSVNNADDLKRAVAEIGLPAVLKTTRFGYDGKGQAKITTPAETDDAWAAMKSQHAILESFVSFEREISVICARGSDGTFAAYDPVENVHRNHILFTSKVPAAITGNLAAEAVATARKLAEALDYVGVLGVEFFAGNNTLYVNEIAPRVHNSGHWTQDACVISQFEQHMRAVAGWPLGSPERHSNVVMTNLLGDESLEWSRIASQPQTGLHLYGKAEARPGRKMGHFNKLTPRQT